MEDELQKEPVAGAVLRLYELSYAVIRKNDGWRTIGPS